MSETGQIVFSNPMDKREYYYTMQAYTDTSSPWVESGCNEIAFLNRGTCNVLVNNVILLQPLDFFSLPGHKHETDTTIYSFVFQGVGTRLLIVVKKTYK